MNRFEYHLFYGGECLSNEYTNAKNNLLWKCSTPEHSSWKARFNHVKNGSWCPHCNGVLPNELRILKAKQYAISRGGECLSNEYINIEKKLIWKCSNPEHVLWEANYIHVVDRNRWCPRCVGKFSKEEFLIFAKTYAQDQGGFCLSNQYIKSTEPLNWKCNNNHIFEDNYTKIVTKKHWCSTCAKEKLKK